MNQLTLPQQSGKYSAFLPRNFYEAPQYASYAPRTRALALSTPQPVVAKTVAPSKGKQRGKPATIHANSLKKYLGSYSSPGHALAELPQLDNIVTGAVNLDFGGNTRPLSKKTVLVLLRRLDVISTANVQEYMLLSLRQCTERHAQRIAVCLRVIEQAASKIAPAKWPNRSPLDETDMYRPVSYIAPCGNRACTVCSGAAMRNAWSLVTPDIPSAFVVHDSDDELIRANDFSDLEDVWCGLE
jgi:hypothetical protein